MKKLFIILCTSLVFYISNIYKTSAQTQFSAFTGSYHAVLQSGDTVLVIQMKTVYCFPPMKFKNKKEERYYWKLVRDVKKTLPYAKLVKAALLETYDYIETLPDDKAKNAHLRRMEKELFKEYEPVLKKMTYSQGKLLIRLIDRECNQSSYNLIKAFLGNFRAGLWQTFGSMFGVSLKSEWEAECKDAMLERRVLLVESGAL